MFPRDCNLPYRGTPCCSAQPGQPAGSPRQPGHNGLILFPTDVPAGPSTTHYIGRIVFHARPTTGVFTLRQESNNQRDVCAELSD